MMVFCCVDVAISSKPRSCKEPHGTSPTVSGHRVGEYVTNVTCTVLHVCALVVHIKLSQIFICHGIDCPP